MYLAMSTMANPQPVISMKKPVMIANTPRIFQKRAGTSLRTIYTNPTVPPKKNIIKIRIIWIGSPGDGLLLIATAKTIANTLKVNNEPVKVLVSILEIAS